MPYYCPTVFKKLHIHSPYNRSVRLPHSMCITILYCNVIRKRLMDSQMGKRSCNGKNTKKRKKERIENSKRKEKKMKLYGGRREYGRINVKSVPVPSSQLVSRLFYQPPFIPNADTSPNRLSNTMRREPNQPMCTLLIHSFSDEILFCQRNNYYGP